MVKNETVAEMNSHSFMLAERLIPATYLQQAAAAKKSRENLIRQLIEQVNYLSLYESQYHHWLVDMYLVDRVLNGTTNTNFGSDK